MATQQLGLKVAFYLYPCLLLLSLLGAQTFQYFRDRRRSKQSRPATNALDDEEKSRAEAVKKRYTKPIWYLQVILCLLLLSSIIVAIRQAVVAQPNDDDDKGTGRTAEFPLSAYLVRASFFPSKFLYSPFLTDD